MFLRIAAAAALLATLLAGLPAFAAEPLTLDDAFARVDRSHPELRLITSQSDVFLTDCNPSTGLRPAFLFGAELDYALGSTMRLVAYPLTWHVQPAFDGTRSFPNDATGLWMRFGVGVGVGVDL